MDNVRNESFFAIIHTISKTTGKRIWVVISLKANRNRSVIALVIAEGYQIPFSVYNGIYESLSDQ